MAGHPHPHPVLGSGWFFAVDDLHRCFIDADVAAGAQPLIHQVDRWLDPLGERDNPGGLRPPRQAHPVAGEDRLLAVQRQRIDVFAGDQMSQKPGRRIRPGQDLRR